ncbi:hypothetical protein JXA34_03215 [Patescibacteria group bacterium]|nr:hypothetical protein [Patescibacteria group bacterium]
MPILAAYFGLSVVDILIYRDVDDFEFVKFPYPYNLELNRIFVDEEVYNKQVLDTVLADKDEELTDFDVIVAGYLSKPKLSVKPQLSTTVPVLINSVEKLNPLFVNLWAVSLRDKTLSRILDFESFNQDALAAFSGVLDFFSTISIYPQISPIEISIRAHLDQELCEVYFKDESLLYPDFPLVFTGDRFSQFLTHKELNYIFMLSMVQKSGIYDIRVDYNNALILSQLLKTYSRDIALNYSDLFTHVGTLLSTTGYTECMVEKEVGTKQLFEVEKNSLYVLPLGIEVKAKLIAKSHETDSIEREITGGDIGLILDTRESKGSLARDINMFNKSIKIFESALRGL